eukprot:232790-Rhodomonas_salina.1
MVSFTTTMRCPILERCLFALCSVLCPMLTSHEVALWSRYAMSDLILTQRMVPPGLQRRGSSDGRPVPQSSAYARGMRYAVLTLAHRGTTTSLSARYAVHGTNTAHRGTGEMRRALACGTYTARRGTSERGRCPNWNGPSGQDVCYGPR